MARKSANSKVTASIDDVAKATLLAEKKGKAPIADDISQEAFGDEAVNSKRLCQDNLPTPKGTAHTCSSEGVP
jgi:predicted DNA repair protein MutK